NERMRTIAFFSRTPKYANDDELLQYSLEPRTHQPERHALGHEVDDRRGGLGRTARIPDLNLTVLGDSCDLRSIVAPRHRHQRAGAARCELSAGFRIPDPGRAVVTGCRDE